MATIAFFPEGAYGPTNNCAGIGAVLRDRGHRVVFIVEESFAGTLEARGFEERLMRLSPPPAEPEVPGQFWKDFIRDTAPVFRQPTIEQLEAFIAPTFQALMDGARYVDDRLLEIIEELEPDVVVEDNVVGFPALSASGLPWVRITSCNPAELKDELVPPVFSGYSAADRSGWDAYWAEYRRVIGPLHAEHDELFGERGAGGLPELELIGVSPWLNMYLYPRDLDYPRAVAPPGRWVQLESCVRAPEADWDDRSDPRPLVYLSLGSLGSADVELMQGLIDTLAVCEDLRVVVSLGPQHELLSLPDHMEGAEYLPQTAILPKASVVITHGGNNTITECMHFGCPMVVLPLFWDQHDNARRVEEQGFGMRLDTYGHDPGQLVFAARRLLADRSLRDRMATTAARLQGDPGDVRAANAIELVATGALSPAQLA
ncbi:MAG TPA: nucleotide disphospho-sugar-binding domain-containing protein [Solirubrobacteraceae bacterium]|nr:nucleotide disphospho-sugar-binding domain-containing protein [Solirubrobacteraceae bacterium]